MPFGVLLAFETGDQTREQLRQSGAPTDRALSSGASTKRSNPLGPVQVRQPGRRSISNLVHRTYPLFLACVEQMLRRPLLGNDRSHRCFRVGCRLCLKRLTSGGALACSSRRRSAAAHRRGLSAAHCRGRCRGQNRPDLPTMFGTPSVRQRGGRLAPTRRGSSFDLREATLQQRAHALIPRCP